jgi:hypothetical protein
MLKRLRPARFVLCVCNRDYLASLELRKVYRLLKDEQASKQGLVRVRRVRRGLPLSRGVFRSDQVAASSGESRSEGDLSATHG